jgi:hypothetical protein
MRKACYGATYKREEDFNESVPATFLRLRADTVDTATIKAIKET